MTADRVARFFNTTVETMPNKFVIYAYPRTGSYHLVSLLNSAPDIVCHGEIFKPHFVELSAWHRDRMLDMTPEDRNADPVAFLTALRALNPASHFGFKMFEEHARYVPHLRYILGADDWRKIVLIRDPIEVYASILRAQKTDIWIMDGQKEIDRAKLHEPVRFTPETWSDHVSAYGHFLRRASDLKNSRVAVYGRYEQEGEMQRLLRFIGSTASPHDLSAGTQKQFNGAIQDGFENWPEFVEHLQTNPAPTLPL